MNKETEKGKNIPRNPIQRVSDEEINSLLELAAAQVNAPYIRDNIDVKKKEDIKAAEEKKKKAEEAKKRQLVQEEVRKKAIAQEEAKKKAAEQEAAKKKQMAREEAKKKAIEQEAAKKKQMAREEAKKKAVEQEAAKKKQMTREEAKKEAIEQETAKKRRTESEKNVPQKDEIVMEEPYVMEPVDSENPYKEKWTFGRVMGTFFETIWTILKIAVIIAVVTVISGFFLSRDLMIRGRNGGRQCLEGMVTASNVITNRSEEIKKATTWLSEVNPEKITMETDDGKILVARKVVTNGTSNKWAVVLHGYGDDMEDIYDIAMHYSEEGYNILMPDLRAHGESEGSFYGMGWLDRLDVINWMDVIIGENPSAQLVIHGVDLGADTALMLSGEPLKGNLKAVVAEGAYTRAWDVVKKEYKVRHPKLPVFPFLHMINPVMKVWAGYSLKEADATKQVAKTGVPILLIAGYNDTYADEEMQEKLDQSIASTHEAYTIVNGAHGDCRYADTDAYYDKTFEFVERFVQ